MELLTFRLIPLPEEKFTLTPEAARDWLEQWASAYVRVLMYGLEVKDATTRIDHAVLAFELSEMLDACASVLSTGKPETLAREHGLDAKDAPAELARIVVSENPDAQEHEIYGALKAELARRLSEKDAA